MREFTLNDMIRNNVSLLAPAEPGLTWAAEAPLFKNRFLVEDIDPKIAVGASFAYNKTTIKAIVGQPASSFWQ